jgi:two-component system OmpR family sensor kinase
MINSLRGRLTLYYLAAFALFLVILATSTYFFLQHEIAHRTDDDLSQLADSFVTTVRAELADPAEPSQLSIAISEAIAEHKTRDSFYLVANPDGSLIASSSDSTSHNHGIHTEVISALPEFRAIVVAANTQQPELVDVQVRHARFRAYARRFATERGDFVLTIFFSMHQSKEVLESIWSAFLIIIPLGLLLASLGGYLMAQKALAPVKSMSEQASRIDAANPEDRLTIENPDDELGGLARSFNELLGRLAISMDRQKQAIEQQKRFMADASHELRTPVAILGGETDVALSKLDRSPAEYRESLQVLRDEARQLGEIVENLFTLTRADAGNYPITRTRFYLDELVAETVRSARALAAEKHIELSVTSEPELVVDADELLARRLIMNLLDNAIKFTDPGGRVLVSASRSESSLAVTVADSGPGIPSHLQARVFERFFRADPARTRDGEKRTGAGLGLAISRWIAEAHNGRLDLTSSKSTGSVFVFTMPATPSAELAAPSSLPVNPAFK